MTVNTPITPSAHHQFRHKSIVFIVHANSHSPFPVHIISFSPEPASPPPVPTENAGTLGLPLFKEKEKTTRKCDSSNQIRLRC